MKNLVIIFLCNWLEIYHRFMFDKIFIPKKYTFKEKCKFNFYFYLYMLLKIVFPQFRVILKNKQLVLLRAYKLHRLNINNYILYLLLKSKNYKRYN